jgi:site-specific DNA-methyltransferase (adenine-specific)
VKPPVKQTILLGDCLDVLADQRNVPAIVADPPANIAFMGRSWDRAHPCNDYILPCTPRSKAHERELRSEESFIRYWSLRYAMAYDIADQHASAIIWTLPRTSYQTATAMRRAGWDIRDNLVHLFGTGWAKTGNALAPGQEGWLLATKGKPELDIDACRVPRGGEDMARNNASDTNLPWGGTFGHGPNAAQRRKEQGLPPLGSLPKNALLSHCEECVRVGVKRVKGTAPIGKPSLERARSHTVFGADDRPRGEATLYDDNGTESVPAWHCLAGCICGARSKWDPEKPLPRCPCGETWRWICAVAEVNGQSGNRPGMSGGGKHRADYQGGMFGGIDCDTTTYADQGGGARFFNTFSYLSKCASGERHAGCESLFWKANKKNPFGFDQVTREEWEAVPAHPLEGKSGRRNDAQIAREHAQGQRAQGNVHPTVKSYRLMHWIHSLTAAKKIVDLCAGSGTGMLTAALDDIEWIGAEICPEAVVIAQARHAFWAGLSHEARRAMVEESIVPSSFEPDEKQLVLF